MKNDEEVQEISEDDSQEDEDPFEEVSPGLSQEEYNKIRQEALYKAKTVRHDWRGRGRGVLECKSCEFSHRSYIDPSYILTGIDDSGLPILQKVD